MNLIPGNRVLSATIVAWALVAIVLGANTRVEAKLLESPGCSGDNQTSVFYNFGTGELTVDVPPGRQLTSINIDSASGIFDGPRPTVLTGSFDNYSAQNIFKAEFGGDGFGSLSFGNVGRRGVTYEFVLDDLTVVGSFAGGGALGPVDLVNLACVLSSELQAGHANEDYQVNEHDIVMVLEAGIYLSGQSATWGEGDWNGAPGGSPGSPPSGDGVFDQLDVIAALSAGVYLTGTYRHGILPINENVYAASGPDAAAGLVTSSVPEPKAVTLLVFAIVLLPLRRGPANWVARGFPGKPRA